MFYVPRGLTKRFSGAFLISISLPAADLEYLIKNLKFSSLKFKKIAFKQCPPPLAIPMIWYRFIDQQVQLNILKENQEKHPN